MCSEDDSRKQDPEEKLKCNFFVSAEKLIVVDFRDSKAWRRFAENQQRRKNCNETVSIMGFEEGCYFMRGKKTVLGLSPKLAPGLVKNIQFRTHGAPSGALDSTKVKVELFNATLFANPRRAVISHNPLPSLKIEIPH